MHHGSKKQFNMHVVSAIIKRNSTTPPKFECVLHMGTIYSVVAGLGSCIDVPVTCFWIRSDG